MSEIIGWLNTWHVLKLVLYSIVLLLCFSVIINQSQSLFVKLHDNP